MSENGMSPYQAPNTCYFTVNASDEVSWVRGGRPQSKAFQEKQAAGTDLTATGLLKVSLMQ